MQKVCVDRVNAKWCERNFFLQLPLLAREAVQCSDRLVGVASSPLGTLLLVVLNPLQQLDLK